MQRQLPGLEAVGTIIFTVIVIGVALPVALSFGMNTAADDLRQQALIAVGQTPEHPRTAWGSTLSADMAADVISADVTSKLQHSQDLDHRADRIRELAAVGALTGLVVMLVTARPEARIDVAQAEASPAASTSSNGTV